jgi:hypothetical protein
VKELPHLENQSVTNASLGKEHRADFSLVFSTSQVIGFALNPPNYKAFYYQKVGSSPLP